MFLAVLSLSAQEIKVKSVEWLQNDITARTHPRKNDDGVECALIRIVVPMVKGIQFSNTFMVGKQEYIPGEYQVWVFPGAKKITFRHENFPSGDIVFADYLKDDTTVLEKEPLQQLSADGELMGYYHRDFWQCMDTQREKKKLEDLWQSGKAPWKVW